MSSKTRTQRPNCVNLYMNVGQRLFYQNNGVEVDEDAYALSIMVAVDLAHRNQRRSRNMVVCTEQKNARLAHQVDGGGE